MEVQNGTCDPITTLITVTVEDPFCPVICSSKDLVCPNTTDDVISICNGPIPTLASKQWYYQINCTGTWYPSPVPGPFDPSNGDSQNTNLIGDQNPWYNSPKVPGPLTTSLCWKVVITPATGAACTTVTSSSPNPTPFHGRIDLFQKPGIPGISVTPLPPQCCGTTFTLTATAPATGTTPFYFEWFHDGKSEWNDYTPRTAGSISTYAVTAPGDYYVRVYNRDHCDYAESVIIHIVCCSVNLTVTAPCCSDGVNPITLIANATSTCGSNPINYLWSGSPSFSSILGTVVLTPLPTYPLDTWS